MTGRAEQAAAVLDWNRRHEPGEMVVTIGDVLERTRGRAYLYAGIAVVPCAESGTVPLRDVRPARRVAS